MITQTWTPEYSKWRGGGWYVHNTRYPSGAIGCVSRNYQDKQWRIVCDPRPDDYTYKSRDDAAQAEHTLMHTTAEKIETDMRCTMCHFQFTMRHTPGRNPGLCPKCGMCADPDPKEKAAQS